MSGSGRAVCVVLMALATVAGCTDDARPGDGGTDLGGRDASAAEAPLPDGGPLRTGVYAELLPDPMVRAALPYLAARGAALELAVPAARLGDAALADLVREATRQGVEVRAWLVLAHDAGYWPGEGNATRFASAVRTLLAWLRAEGLAVTTVVYDMEPDLAYTGELRRAFPVGPDEVLRLMRTHLDPLAFRAARETFAGSVREVQAQGLRAECVTYPQVLDELADGDDDLQDALDVPVGGVPWDEVSFMVYQTAFHETAGRWIGPGLIRSYGASAWAAYGARATVALGLVGRAGVEQPAGALYRDPAALGDDIAAARAEGIGRVEIFSLDGMLALGDPSSWLAATDVAPRRAVDALGANFVRLVMATVDRDLGRRPADAGAR